MEKWGMHGQVAAETLMAVIILLGMLLVVSVIGLQQNEQAKALKNSEEKSALCNHLASTIESAGNSGAQTNIRFTITQPVWIDRGSINFSPDRNNYSCYFFADVNGTSGSSVLALSAGNYTIRRNTARLVEIVPFCEPRRCGVPGSQGYSCGTFLDGCGGEIYCGPIPCPPNACGDNFDNGCPGSQTCICPTGITCSSRRCETEEIGEPGGPGGQPGWGG